MGDAQVPAEVGAHRRAEARLVAGLAVEGGEGVHVLEGGAPGVGLEGAHRAEAAAQGQEHQGAHQEELEPRGQKRRLPQDRSDARARGHVVVDLVEAHLAAGGPGQRPEPLEEPEVAGEVEAVVLQERRRREEVDPPGAEAAAADHRDVPGPGEDGAMVEGGAELDPAHESPGVAHQGVGGDHLHRGRRITALGLDGGQGAVGGDGVGPEVRGEGGLYRRQGLPGGRRHHHHAPTPGEVGDGLRLALGVDPGHRGGDHQDPGAPEGGEEVGVDPRHGDAPVLEVAVGGQQAPRVAVVARRRGIEGGVAGAPLDDQGQGGGDEDGRDHGGGAHPPPHAARLRAPRWPRTSPAAAATASRPAGSTGRRP